MGIFSFPFCDYVCQTLSGGVVTEPRSRRPNSSRFNSRHSLTVHNITLFSVPCVESAYTPYRQSTPRLGRYYMDCRHPPRSRRSVFFRWTVVLSE
eukprot:1487216-Pyramimonas_sp.AAC.2